MASTTHELRTPLNVAQTALTVLESRQHTEEDKRFVKMAQNSCKMLNSLIDDVLDLSRLESGVFELHINRFSLSEMMDEVRDLFALQFELKGLDFYAVLEVDRQDDSGYSDRKRIM